MSGGEPRDDEEAEFDETEFLDLAHCKPLLCTPCAPISTSNGFAALTTEEDDEAAVVAALCDFTANVKVGPKMTQSQRAAQAKPSLTAKQIRKIAAAIDRGEISLPELDLDCDEAYEEVWALVDTGAGDNVANRKEHFPGVKMDAHDPNRPMVKLSTASAEILDGEGFFTVHALTTEGNRSATTFVDANVDMPILSVAKLCEDGSRVLFNKKGGIIWNPETGEKTHFVKRRGVYFLKLLVPKSSKVRRAETGFARQGSA